MDTIKYAIKRKLGYGHTSRENTKEFYEYTLLLSIVSEKRHYWYLLNKGVSYSPGISLFNTREEADEAASKRLEKNTTDDWEIIEIKF